MQSQAVYTRFGIPSKWQGTFSVVGGTIIMIYFGSIQLWPIISIYVASYFYNINPSISYDFLFLVDTLQRLTMWVGSYLGVYLPTQKKCNPNLLIFFGGFVSLVCFYLTSKTTNLVLFVILNSMYGLFAAICYFVGLVTAWEWFPSDKGLVTGIQLGGFGLGSFVFGILAVHFVNPESLNPTIHDSVKQLSFYEMDVAGNVPYMIQTLSKIQVVFICLACLLISRKGDQQESKQSENPQEKEDDCEEVADVIRSFYSVRFWQFFSMMVLFNIYGMLFITSFKPYGAASGLGREPISEYTLTWAASIGGGLVNGLARIIMGAGVDKWSFKKLFVVLNVIQLLIALCCYQAANSPTAYTICILVNYWSMGGVFSIYPVSVTNVFGLRIGSQVYVVVLIGIFIAQAINQFAIYFVLPRFGFAILFHIGALCHVLCLVICFFFEETLDVDRLRRHGALLSQKRQRVIDDEAKYVQLE